MFWREKKGISGLVGQVAAKPTAVAMILEEVMYQEMFCMRQETALT